MTKKSKMTMSFLIIGIILVLAGALYYDVQERRRYYEEYQHTLRSLNDSISLLKNDMLQYKEEIEKLDLERDSIRKEIKIIIKDNEEIDTRLANGDWDYNIRFLTDFLSSEDSVSERHRCSDNKDTAR